MTQSLQDRLAKAEAEIKEVRELLAAKDSKVWRPSEGDMGWMVSINGGAVASWSLDSSLAHYDVGSIFPTKESAERHLERLKVLKQLKDLADGWVFKSDVPNWNIYFDHVSRSWGTEDWECDQYFTWAYFETRKAAENAIKVLGSKLDVLLEG